MNKSYRQGQILKVIRAKEVHTQEELARELKSMGVPATQVTLSRDIRELRLVKTADGYQQMPTEPSGPDTATVISEFLLDVRTAQNLVVLRTLSAHASSIAVAVDQEEYDEVVGTIAGDDTVLVITPDNGAAERFADRLRSMLGE